ncbi:threonylcarbamoyl-AMP synthase [Roseovarius spongiae]|uniref:Threonylcarbamoyl-AMP synthase n=1 Tax=Roseovarius spongiae TaxID=2320272 RepID=A0A3A8AUX8_9RHOB|nr:L-threonylcarbamoyladenylate synthase [Roseovarius spongiae]RKF16033.1 threonylcarbamoyl-AMP synthase [Roseovarius spongiae]
MADTLQTETLAPDAAGIERAAALLAQGALVSFPTETVYGLGGDATQGRAVAGIFAAKDRPAFNPLIVHVADAGMARRFGEWSDTADRLAAAFWPGPLTLVLPLRAGHRLSPLVSAGQDSVALRAPDHPVAQALLRALDRPVAAPSANRSGRISPTRAAHVAAGLGGRIDAILDGGPCPVGVESTILGLTGAPTLLRPGGLPAEALEAALGHALPRAAANAAITAPGQLASHYAPRAGVRLNADAAEPGETLLGFGRMEADRNLSPTGDLTEAAANLFAMLHRLDAEGARGIAVAPIPETGLGRAINDRLRRAAAPRDP